MGSVKIFPQKVLTLNHFKLQKHANIHISMPPDFNDEVIIKEKSPYKDLIQIALLLCLVVGLSGGLFWLVVGGGLGAMFSGSSDNRQTTDSLRPTGVYLTSSSLDNTEDNNLYIYRYRIDTSTSEKVLDVPAAQYLPVNVNEDLVLLDETGLFVPYWRDLISGGLSKVDLAGVWHYQDLAISPDEKFLAFSFISSGREMEVDIKNWSIGLVNLETREINVVSEAMKPVWLRRDGQPVLVFMKESGVYYFDIATYTAKDLFTSYNNLSAETILVGSYHTNRLALVVGRGERVVVIETGNVGSGTIRETGALSEGGVIYQSATFGTNGQRLMLAAANGNGSDLLIVAVAGMRVDNRINLPRVPASKIRLNYWQE